MEANTNTTLASRQMCSSNLLKLSSSSSSSSTYAPFGGHFTSLRAPAPCDPSLSGPGLIRCQTIKFVSFATYESVYFNMWAFYYAKTLPISAHCACLSVCVCVCLGQSLTYANCHSGPLKWPNSPSVCLSAWACLGAICVRGTWHAPRRRISSVTDSLNLSPFS